VVVVAHSVGSLKKDEMAVMVVVMVVMAVVAQWR
jgi:molybdopterin synthase catalytic subunit